MLLPPIDMTIDCLYLKTAYKRIKDKVLPL